MNPIGIPCPACGQTLKIRDRSLLGRKGKCPKCQHAFILEEPEEVELELAEPTGPAVGTSARWIPDGTASAGASLGNPAAARARSPRSTSAPVPVAPEEAPAFGGPSFGDPGLNFGGSAGTTSSHGGVTTSALDRGKSRKRKTGSLGMLVGGAVVVLLAVGAGIVVFQLQKPPAKLSTNPAADDGLATTLAAPGTPEADETGGFGAVASPTKGSPVLLEMIPSGAQIFLHLRPAELWKADGPGEEFRYSLGPLGTYVEQQLTAVCRKPPAAIDEVTFAWIANARGTPPSLVTVVRLLEEAKKSELLELLGGERVDTFGRPVYIRDEMAALILDLKTYAIGPAKMAEDMVAYVGGQAAFATGVEDLITKTDRQRHITLLFEPTAVLLDQEFLAPANARNLLRDTMDWFGDDAETIVWSLHFDADRFYSDLLVRNKSGMRPAVLADRLKEKLDKLATDLLPTIGHMHPREQGKRQLIGRLPAMVKVVSLATVPAHGPRQVQLITPLPDRAAPNLALGTLLAWDESTRTDFSKPSLNAPRPTGSDGAAPAGTLMDRLAKKIDVDFRREPLQGAIATIAEETKVSIDIDGDALKLSGYTKNMPQEFKLDQHTGLQVLAQIFSKYDKMCLVVDEAKKTAEVTTFPVAEQKGLKPVTLPPPPIKP